MGLTGPRSVPTGFLLETCRLNRLSSGVTGKEDLRARFASLVGEYERPLRRLCAAYAGNVPDRDDLLQDILLAIWRAMPGYRGDASVRTWVYRIAHNVALTRRWRKERRDAQERPLEEEAAVDPEMHLRRLALKQAVAAMQPGDRLLTLLWLEGLTALEIEQVTGVKAATVAVRLSRIRRNLRPSRSET